MKRILLLITTMSALMLFTGCAMTNGNADINDRKVTKKIKYGYTKAQVKSILGNPSSTMMLQKGEQWSYIYSSAEMNPLSGLVGTLTIGQAGGSYGSDYKNTVYTIKFNNSGRVVSKKYGY